MPLQRQQDCHQGTGDIRSNPEKKKHNVEAKREQQGKGHVLLLAMAMAPGKQQRQPEGSREAEPSGQGPRGPPGLLLHVTAGLLAPSPSCVLGVLPSSRGDGKRGIMRPIRL